MPDQYQIQNLQEGEQPSPKQYKAMVLNFMEGKLSNFGNAVKLSDLLLDRGGDSSLSGGQKQSMAKLSQAEGLLDEYERSLDEVGLQSFGPLARASGFVRNISSMLGFDPHVKNYNAFRRGTVSPLARALGESGALAEGDVARAIELIPSIGETQYEADLKLNSLRSLLNRAKGSVAGYGGFDELGTGGQMTPPQQAYY